MIFTLDYAVHIMVIPLTEKFTLFNNYTSLFAKIILDAKRRGIFV